MCAVLLPSDCALARLSDVARVVESLEPADPNRVITYTAGNQTLRLTDTVFESDCLVAPIQIIKYYSVKQSSSSPHSGSPSSSHSERKTSPRSSPRLPAVEMKLDDIAPWTCGVTERNRRQDRSPSPSNSEAEALLHNTRMCADNVEADQTMLHVHLDATNSKVTAWRESTGLLDSLESIYSLKAQAAALAAR